MSVGYDCVLEEAEAGELPKINFKRVSKDLIDIQDLVMTLKQKVMDQEYPSDENLAPEEAPEAPPEETVPEPPAEPPVPEAAPEEAPEEAPEAAPEPQAQDDVVNDLADLESMVADIAAELGMDSPEGEEEETE